MGLRAVILVAVSTVEQARDEKQSLETQERELRAIADARGWQVIDVLRIPGFSRDYISWEECAADMLKAGITAMADLRSHCDRRDFDVFMVRDADRFGRTQSLVMQIAETICVRLDRKIYSQMDNQLVEGLQARFWAAMTGLRAAGDQDKRKKYKKDGSIRRAERGLHQSAVPWYHRCIRDEHTGEQLYIEVREEYRFIWNLVYKLVVEESVGYHMIERVLYERYGVVNPRKNKPFPHQAFYTLLWRTPAVWGHRSTNLLEFTRRTGRTWPGGAWVFDDRESPPEGIEMYYNVLPSIYTGDEARAMQDELIRRSEEMHGNRRHKRISIFASMLVCDYCRYHMIYVDNIHTKWKAYTCVTNHRPYSRDGAHCDANKSSIQLAAAIEWTQAFLEEILHGDDLALDRAFQTPTISLAAELETIRAQIAATEAEAAALVARLGIIPDSLIGQFQQQLQSLDTRLNTLKSRQHELQAKMREHDLSSQTAAVADLRAAGGQDWLWSQDPAAIHRHLRRIFGNWRMVVRDGHIIGLVHQPHLRRG